MTRSMNIDRRQAAAWFVLVLAAAAAAPASATTTFTTDRISRQIFCDMPVLRGEFHRDRESYTSNGTCVELEAVQDNDGAKNRSEFDQYNKSRDVWRANWTAEGSYDPMSKVTTETVTLPAPATTEYAPANRPYGKFTSKMICATDPWLETSASCTAITVSVQGNLGSMEKSLRMMKRPFTSTEKEPMRNALIAQRTAALQRFDRQLTGTVAQSGRTAELVNPGGRSLSSRNASTEPPLTRLGPTTALATRTGPISTSVPTVPASAPAAYGTRTPALDWGKAAPSALGSR